eukprot:TRINITY_DN10127_c0_g1_i1.p1 TRINITY_DN10127_c0_g1~~TRINITY_DN10127_c0_g1_i1.p1  ORF type:complete len:521 (-),score=72.93 TRINITY_DN10127_c0_g1_i1:35-1546(-)
MKNWIVTCALVLIITISSNAEENRFLEQGSLYRCSDPYTGSSFTEKWDHKILFYSPAPVGQDPLEKDIDMYTSFWSSMHERDVRHISKLGASHLWLGYWIPNGDHDHFIDITNGTIDLIIPFKLSIAGTSRRRDKDREDFRIFLNEIRKYLFRGYRNIVGIHIEEPFPLSTYGDKDLKEYFELINSLHPIMKEKLKGEYNRIQFYVGLPYDNYKREIPLSININVGYHNYWMLRIEGTNITGELKDPKRADYLTEVYTVMESYFKVDEESKPDTFTVKKKVIPVIRASDFVGVDNECMKSNKRSNACFRYDDSPDNVQAVSLSKMLQELVFYFSDILSSDINYNDKIAGVAIMEYSDEWWRSSLGFAGEDQEGCPNANPYAQTACGLSVGETGELLAIEYAGLFRIWTQPFRYCITPKPSYGVIRDFWTREPEATDFNTLFSDEGDSFCSFINIFPPQDELIGLYISGGLVGLVIILILLVPCRIKEGSVNSHSRHKDSPAFR